MGTIFDKLNYLKNAVNDIQAAINEKQVKVDATVPLGKYGEKIRSIETGVAWADYITMEAFPAFTEDDLRVETVTDVTDDVLAGNIEGLKVKL